MFFTFAELLKSYYFKIKSFLYYKRYDLKFFIYDPIVFDYKNVILGKSVYIRNNARIEGVKKYIYEEFNPIIKIGDFVNIEQNFHLTCAKKIEIGNNTSIAANVTISDINHNYIDIKTPPELQPISVDPILIKENCKIFNNVVILPGVKLGKHNIVGANSVVPKGTYSDYSVIVGSPAYIIKRYCFETEAWRKTDKKGNFI
jgi:acetyltransferase-like isoleucine patch superfamily enzyme